MKAEIVFGVALALTLVATYFITKFIWVKCEKRGGDTITRVYEWLLYAVIEAEKQFGSGTGQLKLRYVYDMFLTRFPKLANWITFDHFSAMVDLSLEEMKHLIETNQNIASYIK